MKRYESQKRECMPHCNHVRTYMCIYVGVLSTCACERASLKNAELAVDWLKINYLMLSLVPRPFLGKRNGLVQSVKLSPEKWGYRISSDSIRLLNRILSVYGCISTYSIRCTGYFLSIFHPHVYTVLGISRASVNKALC